MLIEPLTRLATGIITAWRRWPTGTTRSNPRPTPMGSVAARTSAEADLNEDTEVVDHTLLTQQVIEAIRVAYERANPNPKATERYGGRPGWGRLGLHLHEAVEDMRSYASGTRRASLQKLVNWVLRHNQRMPKHPVILRVDGTRIIVYADPPAPQTVNS
jgi:hypothetical protein